MATHAETMVTKFAELLEKSVGLQSVAYDGTTITYTDLEAKYEFWCKKVARENGTRPVVGRLNLGGG